MHLYWVRGNEIERVKEPLICLYYQPMEQALPHLTTWSFSPAPLYRMGFLPSLQKQPLIQQPIFYAEQLHPHCQKKRLQTEK